MLAPTVIIHLFACGGDPPGSPPTAPESPSEPAPRPAIPEVRAAGDLAQVLSTPLERGSCREGRIRVDGHVVVDASNPAHVPFLTALLGEPPVGSAAVAAGVLWDAGFEPGPEHAPAIGRTLRMLHAAALEDVGVLHCRKLKDVQADGILWNARGDTLGLLTRVTDREAAQATLDTVTAEVPLLDGPGQAAFGDADALHETSKAALKELCEGRTWETSWRMRTLDLGKKHGSLLPLGQHQTGACDLLERGVDPDIVTPRP